MFFSFSFRDMGNIIGVIFVVMLIATFGKFLAGVAAFFVACGAAYFLYKFHISSERELLLQKEFALRKSENTHTISPTAFCRKVIGEVETCIAEELPGTVVEHAGSNVGEAVCEETYRIFYADRIDVSEEDMLRVQVTFTMDAQNAYAAQIDVSDLNIWPASKAAILSCREASITSAAGKIAEAFLAKAPQTGSAPQLAAIGSPVVNPAQLET